MRNSDKGKLEPRRHSFRSSSPFRQGNQVVLLLIYLNLYFHARFVDPVLARSLHIDQSLVASLLELPETTSANLPERAQALSAWKVHLCQTGGTEKWCSPLLGTARSLNLTVWEIDGP